MADTFLVSVADAIGLDTTTGNALFYGLANLNSAFTLSMANTDVRGGKNAPLRYKYFHSRDLGVNIEQSIFEKTFMALNVGEAIVNQVVEALYTECIQLASDDGTLTETPIGDVNVLKEDGTIIQVTPTGKNITVPSGGNAKVTAIYKYSDTVDRLPVGTTNPPSVIDLYLLADIRDTDGILVERLSIHVPRFQIDGSYELSLTEDGVSSESLSGMALAVTGDSCTDGSVYAYIDWVPVASSSVTVAYIAATPANFEPAVGVLPATQQITVNAIRGGVYQPLNVTTSAVYAMRAGSDSDITVDAAGLITVAGTAIATDQGIVDVTYDDGTTVHEDTVIVTVQA